MPRSPWRITLLTNTDCNWACPECFRTQAPLDWVSAHTMDFAVAERVLRAFAPHGLREVIPSTIGEPFLYPHFAELVELCRELNLKMNMTTNGTFPNGGVGFWMQKMAPILSDIKISALSGHLTPEQKDNLKVIFKIRDTNQNFSVSLQSPQPFSSELPFDRIKKIPLWSVDANCHKPNLGTRGKCPFLTREAWVWMDGTFQVCPNPDARYGMRTPYPLGEFGNFAEGDPIAVWEGVAYREFVRTYTANPVCGGCRMRR
jgi:hypothetical protein